MMHTDLTYDEARLHCEQVLIKGRFYKADVFTTRAHGHHYVVKDYAQKGFWERNLVGRIVIRREARAYSALAGVEGIPRRFKRLSPFTFAVEYLEGKDLGGFDRGGVPPEVIRQFERTVNDLHARGWVHLDLHRRTNIMIVDNRVFVVDLASALHPGSVPLVGRYLTALIGFADRLSLIKMKTVFAPELLSAWERKVLKVRNWIMPVKWD
jgi:tRNA A-37 threonylcarbamoyl transferase component Bud32